MSLRVSELRRDFVGSHREVRTSDGITLFLRAWEPSPKDARNTAILIFHGITAHSGPYEFIGIPLSKIGFPTFGLDLRGHGLSDGNRGDCPSKKRFALDLCETLSFLKETYPRVVTIGHSLGVLSSWVVMDTCPDKIDGAVLLSGARTIRPGIMPKLGSSTKLRIALSSIVSPGKPVVKYRREGMTGLDDPLFTFNYTLRFIRLVNLAEIKFVLSLNIPVFVGVGDQDELFSVESVRELYDEIPSEDKEFYVQPGAKHAVFPKGSWTPMMNWLKERFA